jgi:hypothetical protein
LEEWNQKEKKAVRKKHELIWINCLKLAKSLFLFLVYNNGYIFKLSQILRWNYLLFLKIRAIYLVSPFKQKLTALELLYTYISLFLLSSYKLTSPSFWRWYESFKRNMFYPIVFLIHWFYMYWKSTMILHKQLHFVCSLWIGSSN